MKKKFYELVSQTMQTAKDLGIGYLTTGSEGFTSNSVKINERSLVNFSLCDYLALSQDDRVKEGAIKAIRDFGVYTAVSKSYIQLKIYHEAEEYLSWIFNKPVLLFPRTTLAHMGVLPVITDPDDAIILDHQVHTSVRIGADLLKTYGCHIETIRHNRTDILEERINDLKYKYKKIWYLADSIYSTYGDILPYMELSRLLNQYEQFRLYVDDAHGMSWQGENGKGYLLNNLPYHQNMVVISSLGKGFGAGGGIAICSDETMKDNLSKCAAPLIFTSPVDPPTLGAIIESTKIHLSDEIYVKQAGLKKKVDLFNSTARELDLPLINDPESVIMFIASGKTDMCAELCSNLMQRGFYASPSHYPAVPLNNSGVRIVITLYQSEEDIIKLLNTLKEEYDKALDKRGLSVESILSNYKIKSLVQTS
jgi:7-keto-8-aminopelargonate synthetase-like enzyme